MNMQALQAFMSFVQNPGAFFQQRGIQMPPQSAMKSPQGMIDYLMSSGGVSQQQYNQAAAQAKQLQGNPQFMQMMKSVFRR